DRVGEGPAARGDGRRAAEPRDERAPGGAGGGRASGRRGAGERRLLPLPGRPATGRRRRHHGDRAAGRLDPRRGNRGRVRPRGGGAGAYGRAPLPALIAGLWAGRSAPSSARGTSLWCERNGQCTALARPAVTSPRRRRLVL